MTPIFTLARSSLEYLTVAVLGGWWIVSAICQLPFERFERIRLWDPWNLIPQWTFFAPNPGIYDTHLLYRSQLSNGTFTEWAEVTLLEPRRQIHAVWNPNSRQEKVLFDAISELKGLAEHFSPVSLQTSIPYLTLLNFTSNLPRLQEAVGTQFLIVESSGIELEEEPSMLFLSGLHAL